MKNIITTISFLLISINVSAQNVAIEKGRQQYANLAYSDVIRTYEPLASEGYKSVELYEMLANSYYFNGKLREANRWYNKLFIMTKNIDTEYYYRYSQTLKANEEYDKANQYLDKFYKLLNTDTRANLYNKQKNYKEIIAKNSGRYDIRSTAVNTASSEYGAALYGDQLVFASTKNASLMMKNSTNWTSNSFTNLYSATRLPNGNLSLPKIFSKDINTKFHEDSPVFTKDGKTVYFTRNNYNNGKRGKDEKGITLLKLYKATLGKDKNFENIIELPFNSDQYSVAHPALSPDEKTLYFASNMPGSKGESDLYKVAITGNDSYGTPTNLSAGINTEGRETFPYITQDNELYFASDGHQGLGGLDIFATKLNQDGIPGKIFNVGAPVNSPMDDFAFLIDADRTGYFTSNRKGGKGQDDIYSFVEKKRLELECKQEIVGVISNKLTGEALSAKVTLFDSSNKEIESIQSIDGNYTFKVECEKEYYLRGEKEDYITNEIKVTIPDESGKSNTLLPISQKVKEVKVIKGVKNIEEIKIGADLGKVLHIKKIYFNLGKHFIRKDAALELAKILNVLQQFPNMKIDIRSHTDSRSSTKSNEVLSDKRAQSTRQWLISKRIPADKITAKGYGESQLLNKCADGVKCTEKQHQLNRRSEFIILSM